MDSPFPPILLVPLPGRRYRTLRHILAQWEILEAATATLAVEILNSCPVGVVICDAEIEGGDWQALLSSLQDRPAPPNVIISSRLADERLWAEVLNLGGYDVLAQPFDEAEVRRVVHMAWTAWKRRGEGRDTSTPQRIAASA